MANTCPCWDNNNPAHTETGLQKQYPRGNNSLWGTCTRLTQSAPLGCNNTWKKNHRHCQGDVTNLKKRLKGYQSKHTLAHMPNKMPLRVHWLRRCTYPVCTPQYYCRQCKNIPQDTEEQPTTQQPSSTFLQIQIEKNTDMKGRTNWNCPTRNIF